MDIQKHAFTDEIISMVKLGNSVNGNPRYRVTFEDHGTYVTGSDHSFVYEIANPEYKGLVNVYLSRAGRIIDVRPSHLDDMGSSA